MKNKGITLSQKWEESPIKVVPTGKEKQPVGKSFGEIFEKYRVEQKN